MARPLVGFRFAEIRQDLRVRYQNFTAPAELAVGVRYDRGPFFIAAGYELAYWFNMYQHLDIPGWDDVDGSTSPIRADRGTLGLDGFFLNAGVTF